MSDRFNIVEIITKIFLFYYIFDETYLVYYTYVEAPVHLNYVWMVQHYQSFSLFKHFGLFLKLKNLFLFDDFDCIELRSRYVLCKKNFSVGTFT